jgi:hypothetical protein
MLPKILAAVAVAAVTATALASPADAAKRRHYGHYRHYGYYPSVPPSLDGRVTGRPRSCYSDTFIYDNRGVPIGPYCH